MDESTDQAYRVEFAVGVWRQLEALSGPQRERLDRELAELAKRAGAETPAPPRSATVGCRVLRFDQVSATYELAHRRRTLTVLSVVQGPSR
jgi:hypothetical protein